MSNQSHPNQSNRITLPPLRTVLPPGSLPPPAGHAQYPQQQAQHPGYYAQPGVAHPSQIQRGQAPAPGYIPPAPRMGPPPVPLQRAQTPAAPSYGVFSAGNANIPPGQRVGPSTIVRAPQPGGGPVAPPGQKNFVCNVPGCQKAFERRGHLENHMSTHTGVRAYVCHVCQADFNTSSNHSRHMKTQHGL